ncbi:flagellin [Aliiroseovarius sediminilitoris]|uniref:Flagellin n=1 Tax=Aliiroseovarius sediminilitoris TaxID=1173584 RepID=A0A1I0MWV1_9RHOB|nr:flagellin [Aliiroseovarius sediminilitoris]SEV92935.1 flagellin [Aliiroseovarius sediminilitoris]
MSSILTNNSAMVALQTLKSINSNLASTQAEISTGKAIGSAKDNAAVWAISKVMEADVKGFKGISDSLSLGESTVAVARQASETVTDLLTEIKSKIVAAQEDNVDRGKIQTDIVALRNQITSVVGAAQFNGLNLVDGSQTGTNANGNTGVDVLSSLDRKADGSIVTSSIGVDAQNLSLTAGTALAAAAASVGTDTGTAGVIDANDGGTNDSITLDTFAFLDASGGATATAAVMPDAAGVDTAVTTGLVVGDQLSLTIGTVQGSYVVKEGDTAESVVAGMKNAMVAQGLDGNSFSMDIDTNAAQLVITNETNADAAFSFSASRGSGGLAGLATMDVSTSGGADAALGAIENMIQTSIDASATFGSVEGRIEIQSNFVGKLSDSLKAGIGAMVDADMEAASARLQALQVQQQLGTQALSIANQAPQNILSLFR